MELFEKQKYSIQESNARQNIWEGSVRSGKTIASIIRWITYIANAPAGALVMVGKTDRSLKRNIIDIMQELIGNDMQYFSGKGEIHLWGRIIFCYGANDERAEGKIRGGTFAGAYVDEITLIIESFYKMLLSRLSVTGSKLFGTTNPDNPKHWFKEGFLDRRDELDMLVFKFLINDNIFLDPAYVSALSKEYTGLYYKRFILGLWSAAEGAIYDFFDEKINVIKNINMPTPDFYSIGCDYGTQNPFVLILSGGLYRPKTSLKCWSIKEYVYSGKKMNRQKTDLHYYEDYINFTKDVDSKKKETFIDPSAASYIAMLKSKGVLGIKPADNTVLDGIRLQASMLCNGEYMVGESCTETISEYYSYVWDTKAAQRGEDKPLKECDHTKDAERYYLQTKYGKKSVNWEKLITI